MIRNSIRIIIIFGFLSISSCRSAFVDRNLDTKESYSIVIDYKSIPNTNNSTVVKQNLIIDFRGYYDRDTVDIVINNSKHNKIILTTDDVLGTAEFIELKNYERIKNIGIRINNGKLIFIETDNTKHCNILLYFSEEIATVRFYSLLPASM